jgi:hypothetical protein
MPAKDLGSIPCGLVRPLRGTVDTFSACFHLYAFLRPLHSETNERNPL